jgi:hypothetical protein
MARSGRRHWHYRTGFAVTAVVLLFTSALLRITVASVVSNILGPPQGRRFVVSTVPQSALSPIHTDLYIEIVELNEVAQLVTLRVTVYHICETACGWSVTIQCPLSVRRRGGGAPLRGLAAGRMRRCCDAFLRIEHPPRYRLTAAR